MSVTTSPNVNGDPGLTAAQATAVVALLSPNLSALPYIESGLTLPNAGNNSAATMASGAAWINGIRLILPATSVALTASKDNYIDIAYTAGYVGYYVVTPVTIMGAAPVLGANSLRIGYVTTGAATITSATTNAKDSQGNWMGNVTPKQICMLGWATTQNINATAANVQFGTASEQFDNAVWHSITTNNTRITVQRAGPYMLSGGIITNNGYTGLDALAFFVNGAAIQTRASQITAVSTNAHAYSISSMVYLNVGDYVELNYNAVSNNVTLSYATFDLAWTG